MQHMTTEDVKRLQRELRGKRCPHCGSEDRIEDNGQTGPERITYLCLACEAQWEPLQLCNDDDSCDVAEDVFGITITEDRIIHMPRQEARRL